MSVCVVGRESIAVTLATQIAAKAPPAVLCGLPEDVMAAVGERRCPFPDEPELAEAMEELLTNGRLRASENLPEAVRGSRLTIVVARLELDDAGFLDYRWVDRISTKVGEGLARESAVLYDGMFRIGDTRNRFGRLLERASGLRMGDDFGLAFSPGKARPRHVFSDLRVHPKVVGAIDAKTREGIMGFLQLVIDGYVAGIDTIEAAEYIRLVETAARDVNAALALEFAAHAERQGVDLHEALAMLDTQAAFPVCSPGLAVDGPEVAVGSLLLGAPEKSDEESFSSPLLSLSRRIHGEAVPRAVEKIAAGHGDLAGKQVLIFTDEAIAVDAPPTSPTGRLREALRLRGAVPRLAERPPEEGRAEIEVLVVLDPRLHFAALDLPSFPACKLLFDGTSALSRRRVEAAGVRYVGVG